MRGKAKKPEIASFSPGITPAYAGKSKRKKTTAIAVQDHPRLCGEKCSDHIFEQVFVGSPPPMRGKDANCDGFDYFNGITPAYAGKR